MKDTDILRMARRLTRHGEVRRPRGFRLSRFDPADTGPFRSEDKPKTVEMLSESIRLLSELQDRLYAQDRWSLLVIFQAMDAAGKDGAIKHVMSGINPAGCEVHSFKAPSSTELDHDYMWRALRVVPPRGTIGIFNRSYYEEVLVARVHPEILGRQRIPPELVTGRIWNERFRDVRRIERYLARNGTVIRKIFLNVSKEEQKRRFLERIDQPEKNWKFSEADLGERAHWDEYMHAYGDMIRSTSSEYAPWHIVPADNKWFTRIAVASILIEALSGLDLRYPAIDKKRRASLAVARKQLLSED
jgi:PPK2 family polyphosphate:nucleotide phosphotransferase